MVGKNVWFCRKFSRKIHTDDIKFSIEFTTTAPPATLPVYLCLVPVKQRPIWWNFGRVPYEKFQIFQRLVKNTTKEVCGYLKYNDKISFLRRIVKKFKITIISISIAKRNSIGISLKIFQKSFSKSIRHGLPWLATY